MEIIQLNKALLSDYITHPKFDELPNIPISKLRAFSHKRNPDTLAEHIILFLAVENEVLIGYLGVVPQKIKFGNQEHCVGWLSCIWTAKQARGKGVASALIKQAFKTWEGKILLTEYTAQAGNLYLKTGFFDKLPTKKGFRLYLRSSLRNILPKRYLLFRRIRPFLRVMDAVINTFKAKIDFKVKDITYLEATLIDEEIKTFIKSDYLRLIWITHYPWLRSMPKRSKEAEKYAFTLDVKHFSFHLFKIYNLQNEMVGIILFSRKNKDIKIPYLKHNKEYTDQIAQFILYMLEYWKADTFTTFQEELTPYLFQKKLPILHKKPQFRNYMIGKTFKESLNLSANDWELFIKNLQDGDADAAFT